MKLLLDHCVPKPLRQHLAGHETKTAYEMGWERLKNGKLLDAAQVEFDALVTVDQNISHQQNLSNRPIALIVMVAPDNRTDTLLPLVPQLLALLPTAQAGQLYRIIIPVPSG